MKKFLLVLLFIFLFIYCLYQGSYILNYRELLDSNSTSFKILFDLRLPRVLTALLLGVGLSLSGLVYQSLFRNELASPYTLGVSAAAAFGAGTILIFSGTSGISYQAMALAFATLHLCLLFKLGNKLLENNSKLLLGVILSYFFGSLLLVLQYLANPEGLFRISRWLLGNINISGYATPLSLFFLVSFLVIVCMYKAQDLDHSLFGEEFAVSKGTNIKNLQAWILCATSIFIAVAVSFCGPIGFVGVLVPHCARLVFNHRHKNLIPGVCLLGGVFMLFCDLIARSLVAPLEIPVGVVTAIIGAPGFILLLLKKRI